MNTEKGRKRIERLEKELAHAKQEVQRWTGRIRELTSELRALRAPLRDSLTEEDIQEDIRATRDYFQKVAGDGGSEFHLFEISKKLERLEEELASLQR